jgi:hypothetical protein
MNAETQIWKKLDLSHGTIILEALGDPELEQAADELISFTIWFGERLTRNPEVSEGSIPAKMLGIITDLIHSCARGKVPKKLTFNDILLCIDALWELNQLGEDGIPKVLSRFQSLMATQVSRMQKSLDAYTH